MHFKVRLLTHKRCQFKKYIVLGIIIYILVLCNFSVIHYSKIKKMNRFPVAIIRKVKIILKCLI